MHQRVVPVAPALGEVPGEGAVQALIMVQRFGIELEEAQQQSREHDRNESHEGAVRFDPREGA